LRDEEADMARFRSPNSIVQCLFAAGTFDR
jgi:hypothetical protein